MRLTFQRLILHHLIHYHESNGIFQVMHKLQIQPSVFNSNQCGYSYAKLLLIDISIDTSIDASTDYVDYQTIILQANLNVQM